MGDTTHLPTRHIQMTERRFSKLELLNDGTFESDNTSADIAIMPWGGSKGPARDAYNALRESDIDIGWYYTMYIHPMPAQMLEELKKKDLVIVPELNYMGQFSSVLRGEGVNAVSITQYTGLPFKVRDLVKNVKELVDNSIKEGASA